MKKTEYTCDRCGGGISIYGIGYVTDNSMVVVDASIKGVADSNDDTFHLHYKCWDETVDWMKSGSDHADPG